MISTQHWPIPDWGLLTTQAIVPCSYRVTITVNFAWRDQRTGQTVRGFDGLSSAGQFIPNRTVGEFGEDGTRLAVQRLAQDIVTRMQDDNW